MEEEKLSDKAIFFLFGIISGFCLGFFMVYSLAGSLTEADIVPPIVPSKPPPAVFDIPSGLEKESLQNLPFW